MLSATQGPQLFYVDSDGTRMRGERFSVGSGSTFAYGVLDSGFDYNLSVPDAIELGRRAIYHATHRDAYSGGSVNVFHVKETGWEFIGNYDVGQLHWVCGASWIRCKHRNVMDELLLTSSLIESILKEYQALPKGPIV